MINVKSAKLFCKDDISKIENYEKAMSDTTQTWQCHHRTEIWWNCTRKDLIENECYYNRKACELIFLTPAEHRRLHSMNMSEDTRKKISEANKGHTVSDETRRKISEVKKGHTVSDETRRKLSEASKGHKSALKGKTWKLINGKRVYFPKEVK